MLMVIASITIYALHMKGLWKLHAKFESTMLNWIFLRGGRFKAKKPFHRDTGDIFWHNTTALLHLLSLSCDPKRNLPSLLQCTCSSSH